MRTNNMSIMFVSANIAKYVIANLVSISQILVLSTIKLRLLRMSLVLRCDVNNSAFQSFHRDTPSETIPKKMSSGR